MAEGRIKPKRRMAQEPEGTSGTRMQMGRITEELNGALYGIAGIDLYDEMRYQDAMIRGLWLSTILPIIGGDCYVDLGGRPGDKARDKPFAKKVRDFTEEMLMERADRPFPEMLRESLLHMIWGFVVQERGIYAEDGQLWLSDVHLRHPRSILNATEPWVMRGDRLLGIHQNDIYSQIPTKEVFLPRENLLLLTNEREGSNFQGLSNLRACNRPYIAKKNLIQFALIGLERQSMGIPKAKMAETFTTLRQTAMRDMVTNLRSGEDAGVVLSAGEELEILEGKIKSAELLEHIRFHNAEMALAWLASFMTLGQGSGGGFAQSADLTDFFFVALDGKAEFVCRAWERDVIRPLVELNFGPKAKRVCPRLRIHVARENKQAIADIWTKLTSGDNPLLTVSEDDEDWLRTHMTIPPRSLPRPPRVMPAPPGGMQPPSPTKKPEPGQGGTPARKTTEPGNRTPKKD